MRRCSASPPMTCPACGAPVPLASLRGRPMSCPGCAQRLAPGASWLGPLVWPAAAAASLALPWAVGIRWPWLAAAAAVLLLPVQWAGLALLFAFCPPRLRSASAPPSYVQGSGGPTWRRPIALGLADPQPEPPRDPADPGRPHGGEAGRADG